MSNRIVGVRFLLSYGHFIQAAMPEVDAVDIVKKWNERWYQVKEVETITGVCRDSGSYWTVEVADIRAIHTFTLQQAPISPPPLPPPLPGQSFLGMSGVY